MIRLCRSILGLRARTTIGIRDTDQFTRAVRNRRGIGAGRLRRRDRPAGNKQGRNFPLLDDGFLDAVDLEFCDDGATLAENDTPSYTYSCGTVTEPLDILAFLASRGSTIAIWRCSNRTDRR